MRKPTRKVNPQTTEDEGYPDPASVPQIGDEVVYLPEGVKTTVQGYEWENPTGELDHAPAIKRLVLACGVTVLPEYVGAAGAAPPETEEPPPATDHEAGAPAHPIAGPPEAPPQEAGAPAHPIAGQPGEPGYKPPEPPPKPAPEYRPL